MWTAKEGNSNLATHSVFRTLNFRGGQLAVWLTLVTQVIMSDIGVEEEVIVIDIESDIADNNNINVAPRVGADGDPLDGNGNDDVAIGGHKRGQQGHW